MAKARELAPGASIYRVERRSFSSEFYTGGTVKLITLNDLATLNADGPIAISLPDKYAAQVATLDYRRIGSFGRGNVLFVSKGAKD